MSKNLSYSDKLRSCNREALIAVIALIVIALVWYLLGFGLSGSSIKILGVPLWAAAGILGTWIVAVIIAIILSRIFFKDFELDDDSDDALVACADE